MEAFSVVVNKKYIRNIYTAKQCTDYNDCYIAINEIKRMARDTNWFPALRKRYNAILKKMEKLSSGK